MAPYRALELTLVATPETAFHIGTGLGLAHLLDDRVVQGPHVRSSSAELPYIPGSSLKGRLRHHARQLSVALDWDHAVREATERTLFGIDKQPGRLVFADMHAPDEVARRLADKDNLALIPALTRSERTFVSLVPERRVAREGHLFRLELAERTLTFVSTISGYLPDATAERDLGLLLAAVCDLTHIGGSKARGLGRCTLQPARVRLGGTDFDETWQDLVRRLA